MSWHGDSKNNWAGGSPISWAGPEDDSITSVYFPANGEIVADVARAYGQAVTKSFIKSSDSTTGTSGVLVDAFDTNVNTLIVVRVDEDFSTVNCPTFDIVITGDGAETIFDFDVASPILSEGDVLTFVKAVGEGDGVKVVFSPAISNGTGGITVSLLAVPTEVGTEYSEGEGEGESE